MNDLDVLDRLARAAAERPVPRGRSDDDVLREAVLVGRARARAAAQRKLASAAAALGLAAAAAIALIVRPLGTPDVVEHRLGAHAVRATAGTALDVDSLDDDVALRLADGAALFEVAPLLPGHAFVVTTPDATVRVVGTVFSVTVVDARTHVEVFEGEVAVERAGATEHLRAGDTSGPVDELPTLLRQRGETAAAERRAHPPPRPTLADEPTVEAPVVPAPERAEAPPEPVAPRPARTRAPSAIDLETLRGLCDRGAFAEALEAMDGVTPPASEASEWAMLEGDAARALGEHTRAARAYERASSLATPSRAALAGFLAATSHDRAGDTDAALAILRASSAAERGSPLEERALALEARLLARSGRAIEAAERARRYLAGFPGGAAREEMELLAAH